MAALSPLGARRVLVTRPRKQADGLVSKLIELGAQPVIFPAIEIVPLEDSTELDDVLHRLHDFDWVVFTSANGVSAVWERLVVMGTAQPVTAFTGAQIAAIGPATAQALSERGLLVNFVPETYVAEAIAEGMGEVAGQRVLLLRADIARESLAQILQQLGAQVTNVPTYRTLTAEPDPSVLAELAHGVDVVTLTSASTARSFAQAAANAAAAGQDWQWLKVAVVACIGPITADAARDCGLPVHLVAAEYTADGLVRALLDYFEQKEERNLNE